VKRFGKYRRKLEIRWKIWKKSKLNSEKIGKIGKKSKLNGEMIGKHGIKVSCMVIRLHSYPFRCRVIPLTVGHNVSLQNYIFLLYFPYLFTIKLLFFHIFQIISLFN
jgi:hypothetical protein